MSLEEIRNIVRELLALTPAVEKKKVRDLQALVRVFDGTDDEIFERLLKHTYRIPFCLTLVKQKVAIHIRTKNHDWPALFLEAGEQMEDMD